MFAIIRYLSGTTTTAELENSDVEASNDNLSTNNSEDNSWVNSECPRDPKNETEEIDNIDDFTLNGLQEDLADEAFGTVAKFEMERSEEERDGADFSHKIMNVIRNLRLEKPSCFKSHIRTIVGHIARRLEDSLEIETDLGQLNVQIDYVEITFTARTGDVVLIECTVKLEDNFKDNQAKVEEVLKITPSFIDYRKRCVVDRVYDELIILSENAFVLKEDIPPPKILHLDDIVTVDLIECNYFQCKRRAIKLEYVPKNFFLTRSKPVSNINASDRHLAVVIHGERAFFTELFHKYTVNIKAKNNMTRAVKLHSIQVHERADCLFTAIGPKPDTEIHSGEEISLIFEVNTKFYGEFKESYTLTFDTFKVTRSYLIVVAETEEIVTEGKARLTASDYMAAPGRTMDQRNRLYANKVWSCKMDVVPGEYFVPKRRFVATRLNHFDVPEKLQEMYFTLEPRSHMIEMIDQEYPCLVGPLTIDNYKKRFSTLLHLDEITNFSIFRSYDLERAHFQHDKEFLSLHLENLAERRPSLVIGDMVHAIAISNNIGIMMDRKFEGIIHKVLFNRVLLKFHHQFHSQYKNEYYRVEFYFSRFPFRKQHFALSRIIDRMGEDFLFPRKIIKRKNVQLEIKLNDKDDMYLYDTKLEWYDNSLNTIQKRAVYNILRGETQNMPYVIFGPPGTGKTITLIESILQLISHLPSSRLLICAPSNSAADLVTQRLIDSEVLPPDSFIRLVSQHQIESKLIPSELMRHCATVDICSSGTSTETMDITKSGLKLRCQVDYLCDQRIIISTCMTLANLLQMEFPAEHFSHVIIDEAGQCTETETITPIVLMSRRKGQVILAGDPHQLCPIIINRLAIERGFAISFLERILSHMPYCKDMIRFPTSSGYNPRLVTKLLHSYRALPSIVKIYSRMFYEDELITDISETDSPQAKLLAKAQEVFKPDLNIPPAHGVVFRGVLGENLQDNDSPSWFNPQEANEIVRLTLSLLRIDIHPDQIGILTPYVKQVKFLRTIFDETGVTVPKIGSVEEFQGQEREIMLISTVRSTISMLPNDNRLSLGFVGNVKRINVAISRARALMIIVGNPYLLSVDKSWRELLIFCARNNSYYGCELPRVIALSIDGASSIKPDDAEFSDDEKEYKLEDFKFQY